MKGALCQRKDVVPDGSGLDVRIANELVERARRDGLSLTGEGGLLTQLTRTVLQAALDAEMAEHLGYDKGGAPEGGAVGNHRNGSSSKTVTTELGSIRLDVPRDRVGTFEPEIVALEPQKTSRGDADEATKRREK